MLTEWAQLYWDCLARRHRKMDQVGGKTPRVPNLPVVPFELRVCAQFWLLLKVKTTRLHSLCEREEEKRQRGACQDPERVSESAKTS